MKSGGEWRQQLLPFEAEAPTGGAGQNSAGPAGVSRAPWRQPDPASARPTLLREIVRERVLEAAWKQVRRNRGAPGIDGMRVGDFEEWIGVHGDQVRAEILAGTYEPQPVRRVEIPKPGGGVRLLGVPTVLDRVIQQALVIVLTPILDPTFSESSYGFRPGRSAHGAVAAARRHIADGYRWVVDLDLSKFFDRVNHDVLVDRLWKRLGDGPLLSLIRRYLKAGVLIEGVVVESVEGTPQGGPLSPLLSNVLLDEWDRELERRGHRFVRYADDCNIYVRSRRAGERVLASCRDFLERRLRLKVNEEKSAVARPWARQFLGYSVTNGKKPKQRLAKRSVVRLKERVRAITSRSRGISLEQMLRELSRYLRGWSGYFRRIETPSVLEQLDSWIRRRVRSFLLKQWKPGRGRRRAIQKLGVDDGWRLSASRKGPWRLSRGKVISAALPNATLEQRGLVNLKQEWKRLAELF